MNNGNVSREEFEELGRKVDACTEAVKELTGIMQGEKFTGVGGFAPNTIKLMEAVFGNRKEKISGLVDEVADMKRAKTIQTAWVAGVSTGVTVLVSLLWMVGKYLLASHSP